MTRMKRAVRVRVKTDNGPIQATVRFDLTGLAKYEIQNVVDQATDGILDTLRKLPYQNIVPVRNISVR